MGGKATRHTWPTFKAPKGPHFHTTDVAFQLASEVSGEQWKLPNLG